jgi:hypothetical protein
MKTRVGHIAHIVVHIDRLGAEKAVQRVRTREQRTARREGCGDVGELPLISIELIDASQLDANRLEIAPLQIAHFALRVKVFALFRRDWFPSLWNTVVTPFVSKFKQSFEERVENTTNLRD